MTGLEKLSLDHGGGIARRFKVSEYQARSTGCLKTAQITVTRLRAGPGQTEMTEAVPSERAWVVSHQLADLKYFELWKHGRHELSGGYARRTTNCVHLEEEPQAYLPLAYDGLMFHIPELALRELAESNEFPIFDKIMDDRHRIDDVTTILCQSLLPSLTNPGSDSQIFVDHLLTAFCGHLLTNFSSTTRPPTDAGSLSRLQSKKAMERLSADLTHDFSLAEIAADCNWPLVTFSRAFRLSVGLSPYQWLQQHRLDTARRLLTDTDQPIAAIAHDCGFADQSHLTHAFKATFSMTPLKCRLSARS